MFSIKRFNILIVMVFFAVSIAAAQSGSAREMTVEETYLRESLEVMIIRESARTDSREQKLIALEYIGEALERGNKSEEIRETLEYLSREGVRSVARENGRVVNNFPDVRRQSARYLGQIGTVEAKNALLEIVQYETEPMVLQEAIKSLGDIGLNENNETILNIVWVVSRLDNLVPDNLVALATIDTFEKIARKNGGLNSPEAIQLLIRISVGSYLNPIRERARQLIAELRNYGR